MTQKVKLLEKHIELLESLPEQGIGYQLVDIQMADGQLLTKRIVLNSSYLVVDDLESIDPTQIKSIRLY
jgi:hypothetical protein